MLKKPNWEAENHGRSPPRATIFASRIGFEALFEFALGTIFDLLIRAFATFFDFAGYTLLGAAAGALSLFIIPHPLFRPSRFHGIGLLVSPILTGLGMRQVGLSLRTKARTLLQIESFWNGFAFALGVALI